MLLGQLGAHIFSSLKNKFVGFRYAQPKLHSLLIYKLISQLLILIITHTDN